MRWRWAGHKLNLNNLKVLNFMMSRDAKLKNMQIPRAHGRHSRTEYRATRTCGTAEQQFLDREVSLGRR